MAFNHVTKKYAATVIGKEKNARFLLEVDVTHDGKSKTVEVNAIISGSYRKSKKKIIVGDKVNVEINSCNLSTGRICF